MTTQDKPAVGPLSAEDLVRTTVATDEVFRLTLCGSTKFRAEYELWNKRLTLAGFLVYSVSGFGHSGDTFTEEEKSRLDQIHLAKIDASHAIVVLNVGGYVGESTSREIAHAKAAGKPVYFLEGDNLVYRLRTGPDGPSSLRYRAFDWGSLAPTAPVEAGGSEPVEVTIFCPKCATPHVDEGEWATTRHHKTHQCQSCGHEWRPFPFATVGVPHPALRPQPSGETREAVARVEAMLPAIERIFPVHVTETPDYAELAFHECAAQAMTMEPDTWTALNTLATDLRALLLPAEQGGGDDLRATCQAILDDHQTSETHHPDHILIRRADFERIAALIRPAIPASEGGRG